MEHAKIIKVMRVNDGVGFRVPNSVSRELRIARGEYFGLSVIDEHTIVLTRVNVLTFGSVGEAPDNNLPIINHE